MRSSKRNQVLLTGTLVLLSFFSISKSFGENEITILDVKKTLAMSDKEVTYRDYYLSHGNKAGLRLGMILIVKRKVPLYDSFRNRNAGTLNVPVARIKIIQVESDLAVARFFSELNRKYLPLLEDNFIMVGDFVELRSATTEEQLNTRNDSEKGEESQKELPIIVQENSTAISSSATPEKKEGEIKLNPNHGKDKIKEQIKEQVKEQVREQTNGQAEEQKSEAVKKPAISGDIQT
ncbi:MAG: hypothetical protein K1X29_01495 [Bdellovibrionales bacterium]|nr:hypothetical protein [Bdellovibrionales bacterium]